MDEAWTPSLLPRRGWTTSTSVDALLHHRTTECRGEKSVVYRCATVPIGILTVLKPRPRAQVHAVPLRNVIAAPGHQIQTKAVLCPCQKVNCQTVPPGRARRCGRSGSGRETTQTSTTRGKRMVCPWPRTRGRLSHNWAVPGAGERHYPYRLPRVRIIQEAVSTVSTPLYDSIL